jgi:hypothetical protein
MDGVYAENRLERFQCITHYLMFIAEDFIQFKNLFVTQLKKMLSDDELGAFILVLANSQQDEFLKDELQYELKETFAALKNNFSTGSLKTTQDDSDVFKQLLDIDLEDIPVWKYRAAGDWEVSCNIMRQLRPMRRCVFQHKSLLL